eukprot:g12135.t1
MARTKVRKSTVGRAGTKVPRKGPAVRAEPMKRSKSRPAAGKVAAKTVMQDAPKKRRARPGMKAMRDIRKLQSSSNLLLPSDPFRRLLPLSLSLSLSIYVYPIHPSAPFRRLVRQVLGTHQ